MPTATTGLVAESQPAALWSVTATGADRHVITRNAAYFALPALTWAPEA
jgi:hypothetical protein